MVFIWRRDPDLLIQMHHPWIYNLMKTHLWSSPYVVNPPPSLKLSSVIWPPSRTKKRSSVHNKCNVFHPILRLSQKVLIFCMMKLQVVYNILWNIQEFCQSKNFFTKGMKIGCCHSVSDRPANAITPWITRSSAIMVLIWWDKQVLVFYEWWFQPSVPSWEMMKGANMFSMFPQINSAYNVSKCQRSSHLW